MIETSRIIISDAFSSTASSAAKTEDTEIVKSAAISPALNKLKFMLSPLKFINVRHTVSNFKFENHSQL